METFVSQLNNKIVAAFFNGGVEHLVSAAAFVPRLPLVQLVDATDVCPHVEVLAGAFHLRIVLWNPCNIPIYSIEQKALVPVYIRIANVNKNNGI